MYLFLYSLSIVGSGLEGFNSRRRVRAELPICQYDLRSSWRDNAEFVLFLLLFALCVSGYQENKIKLRIPIIN
jgi:hypothetical protein